MNRFLFPGLMVILFSCHSNNRPVDPVKLTVKDTSTIVQVADSARYPVSDPDGAEPKKVWTWPPGPPKDTLMEFDIDGVSLEGSGVKAWYTGDTIRSAVWDIYGETFQAQLTYTFFWNGVTEVKDRYSKYKVSMGDVRSDKDMVIDSVIYQIDSGGMLLHAKGLPERIAANGDEVISLFRSFRNNVPLVLHN